MGSREMRPYLRLILLGALYLPFLSGCGSSSIGTSSGTEDAASSANSGSGTATTGGGPPSDPINAPSSPAGSNNSVTATPSVAGIMSVASGGTQTVSITFASSDGKPISGFGVTAGSGA